MSNKKGSSRGKNQGKGYLWWVITLFLIAVVFGGSDSESGSSSSVAASSAEAPSVTAVSESASSKSWEEDPWEEDEPWEEEPIVDSEPVESALPDSKAISSTVPSASTEVAASSEEAASDFAAASSTAEEEPEEVQIMVWIPATGSKYHSRSNCSGMNNPRQVTLEEAESRGYEPCKMCH